MNSRELTDILLLDNVYEALKEKEAELFEFIPEFKLCKGIDQKNSWHVYDVLEHIFKVVKGVEANEVLRLTALFHDVGKPAAFSLDAEGVGHFYGHWDRSVEIFSRYAPLFSFADTSLIKSLIFYHDVNVDKMSEDETEQMIASLGKENLHLLFKIKRADLFAQSSVYHGTLSKINEQEERILEKVSGDLNSEN